MKISNSHLAITGHYLARSARGDLILKSDLLAFRKLEGSHSGVNLGKAFVQILKEVGIIHKVCASILFWLAIWLIMSFTLDLA